MGLLYKIINSKLENFGIHPKVFKRYHFPLASALQESGFDLRFLNPLAETEFHTIV